MDISHEPLIALPDVPASNDRHDREHGNPYEFNETRIRSGWNEHHMARRAKLTDKKIKHYQDLGYYSADFKEARRELWEKKAARRAAKRDGNFDLVEGRMIYRPD